MSRKWWAGGSVLIVVGGFCVMGLVGCQQGSGGGRPRNSNDNTTVTPPPAGQFATGAILDPDRFENLPQAINPFAAASNQPLPRSADITSGFPSVGDQGAQSSCVAWAAGYASATYGANRQFEWGNDTAEHQASPGYLYAKLVEVDASQGTACGTGTLIATAMNLLVQGGCSSFATVGYSDQACENPSESDAANFRIGSFKRVEPGDRNGVKAELAAGNAVVIGCKLYEDFMQFTGDSVFDGNGVFLTQGNQHAAHAMAVVGYDDDRGAYRIINSWGTGWGDNGFIWMSYATFEATTFEVYSLLPSGDRQPPNPDPGPGPDPDPTPDGDPQGFLDDAFQFAVEDEFTGLFTVYLVFYWHFDAPVLVHSITVTAPDGSQGQQVYESWYSDGYVAFFRSDGLQWLEGAYGLEFDTTTQAGNDVPYSGETFVAALDEDGGDTGEFCNNLCFYAFDGECDDGAPDADFAVCDFGTDCGDCGPRDEDGGDDGDLFCDDTCVSAGDGECDDGGEGSLFDVCLFGTDCTDCGPRDPNEEFDDGIDDFEILCDDSCPDAFDGFCDDGGEDSDSDFCLFGTDCSDCGSREFPKAVRSAKAVKKVHRFRGIEVKASAKAKVLPAAGVTEGTLGENGKPLTILSSPSN